MKNSIRTSLSIIIALLISAEAWALSAREFRQSIQDAYKTCGSLDCAQLNMQIDEAQGAPLNNLDDVAFDLAQVWGDTILESDYEADEKIILERLEVVSIHGEIVGFRMTYSAQAFDHANKVTGVIRESGFITADGSKSFVDPSARAQFIAD